MKTPRPRNPRSEKAHQCDAFRKACAVAGIDTPPSCGVAAINLALRLRAKPLPHAERVAGNMKKSGLCSVGTLILAGLARYVAAEKMYVITPAGETWLTELEIAGFLNADVGIRAPQEVAA